MSLRGLYDTGADISCISDKTFRKLSPDNRPPRLIDISRSTFKSANGDPLEVRGKYLLKVRMGKTEVEHPFFVVKNLSEDLILGIDFIHTHELNYNATSRSFRWRGGPSWTEGNLKICKAMTIEALGSQLVRLQVRTESGAIPRPQQTCMVNIISQDNPFLTGGPFLVEPDENGHVRVLVTNCSPIPVDLERNEFIGVIENLEGSELREISPSYISTINQKLQSKPPTPLSPEKKKFILEHLNLQQIPEQFRDQYRQVILKHHEAISRHRLDLGRTSSLLHDIELKTLEPVYVKQFKIPEAHRQEVEKHVAEWLKLGVVQPARSKFNSPLFAVAKKNGGIRLVQDFRALNAQTFVDKYSMKDVSECIGDIGRSGSTLFTTIDLTAGFWQLLLHPKARPYTAFTVPGKGQFQWVTTPMGLLGAPSSFQRLMEKVVHGIHNVLVYIDDLLLHSETHEQHLQLLDQLLGRLEAHQIKMNLEKCVFGAKEVSYLGFHLTPEGVKPGIDKLKAVARAPVPNTVREVRQFLGLCNFFRNHVKNFAQVSAPLTKLTRKEDPWKTGPMPEEAFRAFRELQTCLVSEPVMAYPRRDRPYALITDASLGDEHKAGGLGAILTQMDQKGTHQVIAYASRKLQKHEGNYTPFLLEMQAALWGMEHFSTYLRGRHFTLFTDHKPLEKLGKVHTKTLNRLQEAMNSYDFEICYKKGEEMPADFLSRNVVSAIGWTNDEMNRFQEADPLISNLKKFLLHKQLHPDPKCRAVVRYLADDSFIENDLVWKRVKRVNEPSRAVLYLPLQLQEKILAEAHGTLLSGHDGVLKTKERIFSTYYWPGMDKDINEHIQRCHKCQIRRKVSPQTPALLSPLAQCTEPGQRVHADLFGPLKTSGRGKKFILCITDAFTKYVELVALPNKESATVAQAIFERWICRFGMPLEVITDGGKEFVGQLTKDLFKLLGIQHTTTSPYHPQCNSQAEVANKTIAKYLASFVADSTLDWEDYLWPLMFTYNTSFHRSIRTTPFFLTFGMEPRDGTFSAGDLRRKFYGESSTDDLIQRLRTAREVAQHNNMNATSEYKQYHDRKAEPHSFLRGQKVLLQENYFLGKNAKLSPKWSGPHEILRLIGETNVELKLMPSHRKLICHVNRLKPYNFSQPDIPPDPSSATVPDWSHQETHHPGFESQTDPFIPPGGDALPLPSPDSQPRPAPARNSVKLAAPDAGTSSSIPSYADKLRASMPLAPPRPKPDILPPQSERPSMIQVRLSSLPVAQPISNLSAQDFSAQGGMQQQQLSNVATTTVQDDDKLDNNDWVVVRGRKKPKPHQSKPHQLRSRQSGLRWNRNQQKHFLMTGDIYDTGPGYEEAVFEEFFEPFAQQLQPQHQQQLQPQPQPPAQPQQQQQPQPPVQPQPQQQPQPQAPPPPLLPKQSPQQPPPLPPRTPDRQPEFQQQPLAVSSPKPLGGKTTTKPPSTEDLSPYLVEFEDIDGRFVPGAGGRSSRRTGKLPDDIVHHYPEEKRKKK